MDNLSYQDCFGEELPNIEIFSTYDEITKDLWEKFRLRVPEWWNQLFSMNNEA
jgi:hypothetical protein